MAVGKRSVKFDISVIGDKKLMRKFDRLSKTSQRKVLAPELKRGTTRAKKRVIENLRGKVLDVVTGVTIAAFKKQRVKAFPVKGGRSIRYAIELPTREELGIPPRGEPGGDHYYPFVLEYGTPTKQAFSFMRPAIDEHKQDEIQKLGDGIGRRMIMLASVL